MDDESHLWAFALSPSDGMFARTNPFTVQTPGAAYMAGGGSQPVTSYGTAVKFNALGRTRDKNGDAEFGMLFDRSQSAQNYGRADLPALTGAHTITCLYRMPATWPPV